MVDFPPCDDVCGALEEHVRRFFTGRKIDAFTWTAGPVLRENPHFRAFRIAPDAHGGVWTYVSVGGWAATEADNYGLEFILCTPEETPRGIELLAMTVHYHRGGKLGIGHTLPVGQPWLPNSLCDQMLLSLPYPFGPDLGESHVGDRHVDFVWLLPITPDERRFKVDSGLEALETRFDEAGIRYWDINRQSVV